MDTTGPMYRMVCLFTLQYLPVITVSIHAGMDTLSLRGGWLCTEVVYLPAEQMVPIHILTEPNVE